MQGVVTYQRRDGRWVTGRATFAIREFEGSQRGVADSSAESHLRFLENEAAAKARETNQQEA